MIFFFLFCFFFSVIHEWVIASEVGDELFPDLALLINVLDLNLSLANEVLHHGLSVVVAHAHDLLRELIREEIYSFF